MAARVARLRPRRRTAHQLLARSVGGLGRWRGAQHHGRVGAAKREACAATAFAVDEGAHVPALGWGQVQLQQGAQVHLQRVTHRCGDELQSNGPGAGVGIGEVRAQGAASQQQPLQSGLPRSQAAEVDSLYSVAWLPKQQPTTHRGSAATSAHPQRVRRHPTAAVCRTCVGAGL